MFLYCGSIKHVYSNLQTFVFNNYMPDYPKILQILSQNVAKRCKFCIAVFFAFYNCSNLFCSLCSD